METTDYVLPDGRVVAIYSDVARNASTLDYALADGRVVMAVIAPRKNRGAVALGRRGGSVVSDAKSAAARANGAKGGRPKRVTVNTLQDTPDETKTK